MTSAHWPALAVATLAVAGLAGCAAPAAPSAPPVVPPTLAAAADACRALRDSLVAAVPPGESLAELQARGIRVRTPLSFAPGSVPRPVQPSGAALQLQIAPDGTVVPGSPKILTSVGEAQIGDAMQAAALSMTFDIDAAARPAAPVPFTTTFAVCQRR